MTAQSALSSAFISSGELTHLGFGTIVWMVWAFEK
jgi:hypothetical protein